VRPETIVILSIFLFFALAEFMRTNLFHKPRQHRKDGVVEIFSTLTLVLLTQPFVLATGFLVTAAVAPQRPTSAALADFSRSPVLNV
jgi:hypothetical protein